MRKEWLDGKKPNKIYVHPLLLVLGDHALNDLFGDEEDSVVNVLKEAGYEVEETEIIASKDGRPPKIKKRKRHIPPSLEAAREYQRLYGKLGPIEE